MAREKKPVHKVYMTEGKRNIIQQLCFIRHVPSPYNAFVVFRRLSSSLILRESFAAFHSSSHSCTHP